MLKDKTVAAVVPAFNEETQITRVVETMPDFVDRIIVIDPLEDAGDMDPEEAALLKNEPAREKGETGQHNDYI